ncbi:MAG: hypothetical protein HC923_10935 [Myxococcales bacterium]|nr:hypothetical protein [Myxococcales bacterium]
MRAIAWALFLLLAAGALFLAPPSTRPGLVSDLMSLRGPDPILVAIFQAMGLLPLFYARVLLRGLAHQRLTPWPFVLASFVVGGFVLLPAAALRRYGSSTEADPRWLRRFTEGRVVVVVLGFAAACLIVYAVGFGDLSTAVGIWRSDRFVFTYVLDFAVTLVGYPLVAGWERRAAAQRRSTAVRAN